MVRDVWYGCPTGTQGEKVGHMLRKLLEKTQALPQTEEGNEQVQILSCPFDSGGAEGVSAMAAGATETGCIFQEHGGPACRKVTASGSNMCPHHNLLTEHREQEKAKKEREKAAKLQEEKQRRLRNGRRG